MIENIVLEGGGVKGVAYAGVLQALEDTGNLETVKRVAGASAGAMAAALISFGYTSRAIKEILTTTSFAQFEDNRFVTVGLIRTLFKYGWNSGSAVKEWFGKLMEDAGLERTTTFIELAIRCPEAPDLYLKGTNISTGTSVTFCAEETPDMAVLDAVRISMSIPFFFSSVKLNGEHYADGGVLNNYPIQLFDRRPFFEGQGVNPYTLGFRLDSEEEFTKPAEYSTRNFIRYASAIVRGLYNATQTAHLKEEDWARTVRINTADISATYFNLSEGDIDYLLGVGERATLEYLNQHAS